MTSLISHTGTGCWLIFVNRGHFRSVDLYYDCMKVSEKESAHVLGTYHIGELTGLTASFRTVSPHRAKGYKPFSCSTQQSTKFILLINVKTPTIIGILTFISMINTTSEIVKVRYFFYVGILVFKRS